MANNNLFRKSSLDRVSSPEQLDEYVKVTSPNLILIIIAIFSILFAGIVWIFNSDIPKYEKIPGIVITENGVKKLYSFVDIGTSQKFKIGMQTRISPEYISAEEYGYINGEIESVGKKIIDTESILKKFKNPNMIAQILPAYNCVEVVTLLKEPSKDKIAQIEIIDGSQCTSSVIIGRERAIDFILNK